MTQTKNTYSPEHANGMCGWFWTAQRGRRAAGRRCVELIEDRLRAANTEQK